MSDGKESLPSGLRWWQAGADAAFPSQRVMERLTA